MTRPSQDGAEVYDGSRTWILHDDLVDRRSWEECSDCGATGYGDRFRSGHACWFNQYDNIVLLTVWMAEHGYDRTEVAYAVEKPWKFRDEATQAGVA